jgi:hypothetical protein
VSLVDVRGDGRQRVYRLNGQPLRPVYDWVKAFGQTWSQRFSRLDAMLGELNDMEDGDGSSGE